MTRDLKAIESPLLQIVITTGEHLERRLNPEHQRVLQTTTGKSLRV